MISYHQAGNYRFNRFNGLFPAVERRIEWTETALQNFYLLRETSQLFAKLVIFPLSDLGIPLTHSGRTKKIEESVSPERREEELRAHERLRRENPIYHQLAEALKKERMPEEPIATAALEIILNELIEYIPAAEIRKFFPRVEMIQEVEIEREDGEIERIERPKEIIIREKKQTKRWRRPQALFLNPPEATRRLVEGIVSGEVPLDEKKLRENKTPAWVTVYKKILSTILPGNGVIYNTQRTTPERLWEEIQTVSREEKDVLTNLTEKIVEKFIQKMEKGKPLSDAELVIIRRLTDLWRKEILRRIVIIALNDIAFGENPPRWITLKPTPFAQQKGVDAILYQFSPERNVYIPLAALDFTTNPCPADPHLMDEIRTKYGIKRIPIPDCFPEIAPHDWRKKTLHTTTINLPLISLDLGIPPNTGVERPIDTLLQVVVSELQPELLGKLEGEAIKKAREEGWGSLSYLRQHLKTKIDQILTAEVSS